MLIGAFEDDSMLGCCMMVEENPGHCQAKANGRIK